MTALRSYKSITQSFDGGDRQRPFVTMWRPDHISETRTYTFAEFLEFSERFAGLFYLNGIRRGDRIVLIMPQDVPLMAAFTGAMLLGAVPTILAFPTFKIDPDKYRSGLSGVTQNIAARTVLIDAQFPQNLKNHIALGNETRLLQVEDIAALPASQFVRAEVSSNDVAFIQHSAGTTGLQKGVALSHGSVLNQLDCLAERLQLTGDDKIVSWLPLYHDMGLIACFILPLVLRLQIVMQSPTDWVLRPASMLHLASEHRCTLCWIPNFAFQFLAHRVPEEDRVGLKLDCLRAMINCSEPVRHHSMQAFHDVYGAYGISASALHSSYAMAENTFAVTQTSPDHPASTIWADSRIFSTHGMIEVRKHTQAGVMPLTSSGSCLRNNAVRILRDDGTELREGQVGEIAIRSDSMFEGYYNRPDLSEKVLRAGWYMTRDMGFILDNELFVIGRKDDTVIIGGRNFYPQDIEEIVFKHPAIHPGRAVAFGVYSSTIGTDDLAVVAEVSDSSSLRNASEIAAEIRRSIVGELEVTPKWVEIVAPKWIVKSTAGKPARSATREKFLSTHPEIEIDPSKP